MNHYLAGWRSALRLLTWLAPLTLLAACLDGGPPTPPPAAAMLPTLPGYQIVEGQTLTDHLSTAAEGAALLAGQPQLAATVAVVDQIISCYQDIGAARARVYSQLDNPLNAGAVAIADRQQLQDPVNLFRCATGLDVGRQSAQSTVLQPCTASYTVSRDDNAFYIVYAGSTAEICRAFCSQLPECTAHP